MKLSVFIFVLLAAQSISAGKPLRIIEFALSEYANKNNQSQESTKMADLFDSKSSPHGQRATRSKTVSRLCARNVMRRQLRDKQ